MKAGGRGVGVADQWVCPERTAEPPGRVEAVEGVGVEDDAGARAADGDFEAPDGDAGGDAGDDPVEDAGAGARVQEDDGDPDDDAAGQVAVLLQEEEGSAEVAAEGEVAAFLQMHGGAGDGAVEGDEDQREERAKGEEDGGAAEREGFGEDLWNWGNTIAAWR